MSGFTDHSRLFGDYRHVYPVVSRRSGGLSIGVNLSLDQRCNFHCNYCQVDRSEGRPYRPVDIERIDTELRAVLRDAVLGTIWNHKRFENTPPRLRRLADIALSGDGESTVEKGFPQVVDRILAVKSSLGLEALPLVVITNTTGVTDPEVAAALGRIVASGGAVWAKLDAGTEDYYRRVNDGPVSLDQIESNIAQIAKMGGVTVQSLFMRIDGVGPSSDELRAYRGRLKRIAEAGPIQRVQVYTVARPPRDSNVTALSDAELDVIAADIRQECGVAVEIAYAPRG